MRPNTDCYRTISINGVNFFFRVQSYNFFTPGQPLSLQTNIEILHNNEVVGSLQGCSELDSTIPLIAVMQMGANEVYHAEKGIYHREEGREIAQQYLASLSDLQLEEALLKTFYFK